MTKRMLIDGTHPEETRVVITDGNRLDEYDIETSTKTQLKGNIYLAKVTRVEPSLQAAFVDYGGGRHGFLAFNEIHPDYYQIPIEDREALKRDLAEFEGTAEAAHAHVEEMDGDVHESDSAESDAREPEDGEDDTSAAPESATDAYEEPEDAERSGADSSEGSSNGLDDAGGIEVDSESEQPADFASGNDTEEGAPTGAAEGEIGTEDETPTAKPARAAKGAERRGPPSRRYKIQEVIKRRQILLVQVVKEERGNKGAALTTYLSLAGRYCVLMPNATRSGGGVSRKITSAADRRRLRDLLKDLNVPEGMGVIMRTAGMARNKSEIKRDFDYLMRLWEDVRALTLQSAAPALVYEEGDLIKRAIRDLYARDIEEVHVEGTEAYTAAKKLMRMMMPSHAKRVQPYRDTIPLFHRYQVETQLEAMHNPVVQLKSGGYIVIDTTEALVAIDVNSGRSTKERNIEETAVKTNLEAATEIARQLRLRDLAGLIVIDFIDMDENRNQRAVEKRLKEAVKTDRARIQLGRISTFGLFELSRQRLRPSIIETSTEACPHCHGSGFVRSTESTALHALRMIEEEGIRMRSSELSVAVPTAIALYILNQKRQTLISIEGRYGLKIDVLGDDSLIPPDLRIERVKAKAPGEMIKIEAPVDVEVEPEEEIDDEEVSEQREEQREREPGRKRRSRRRRKKEPAGAEARPERSDQEERSAAADEESDAGEAPVRGEAAGDAEPTEERSSRRRRRGRRGGRRRGQRTAQGEAETFEESHASGGNGVDAASMEPVLAEAVTTEQPEPVPEPVVPETIAPLPEVPQDVPIASSDAGPGVTEKPEPASAPETVVPPQPESPPRRGWWQRIIE